MTPSVFLKLTVCAAATALSLLSASAQTAPHQSRNWKGSFSWEYDVDFQHYFDNREFAASRDAVTESRTFHATTLTPWFGFSIMPEKNVSHRVMLGLLYRKEMGSRNSRLTLDDVLLDYDMHLSLDGASFEAVAGRFPRSYMEGEYSEAFFSDSLKFTDPLVEGLLFKYKTDVFYAEMGLDWMGDKTDTDRERFQIYTAGAWSASRSLTLGWSAELYHYASTALVSGAVVDNHLFNPYLRLDAGHLIGLEELSLKAGLLTSFQRDRNITHIPVFPTGGEFTLTGQWRRLSMRNLTYFGNDLMPMYEKVDKTGAKYGNSLYFGNPFYRGFYDMLQFQWAPKVSAFLTLRLSARFHFASQGFMGWQQLISLDLDLDAFRHPRRTAGRVGKPSSRRAERTEVFIL